MMPDGWEYYAEEEAAARRRSEASSSGRCKRAARNVIKRAIAIYLTYAYLDKRSHQKIVKNIKTLNF